MGACMSSSSTQAMPQGQGGRQQRTVQEERMNNEMTTMMQTVMQHQQQHVANQQQMVRDDPECKDLMDRQMKIQQQILAAFQAGDQNEVARVQSEAMALQQHPKYLKLMMPTMPNPKMMHTKVSTSNSNQKTSTFSANPGIPVGFPPNNANANIRTMNAMNAGMGNINVGSMGMGVTNISAPLNDPPAAFGGGPTTTTTTSTSTSGMANEGVGVYVGHDAGGNSMFSDMLSGVGGGYSNTTTTTDTNF